MIVMNKIFFVPRLAGNNEKVSQTFNKIFNFQNIPVLLLIILNIPHET